MKVWPFTLFTICLLQLGCNYIPCSSSSDLDKVRRPPNPSLIAGIYKPDRFTKQDFKEYSHSDSTFLVISVDGKIILNKFPKSTFGSWDKSEIDLINGSGTWTANSGSGTTNINTNIVFDQKEIMLPSAFRLFKKENKYYILIDFGDPDNCSSVRLQQQ